MLKKRKKTYINKAQEPFLKVKISFMNLFKWVTAVPTESDGVLSSKKINTEKPKKNLTKLSFYLPLIFFAVILLSSFLPETAYGDDPEDMVNYQSDNPTEDAKESAANSANPFASTETDSWAAKLAMDALAYLSVGLLSVLGYILTTAGMILDFVIENTIVKLTENINGMKTGIELAWLTLRDIANMLFIFVLLYVSIATILQLSSVNTKRMLKNVVIVALLINFSMFFTEVVIDVTNTFAIAFDSAIRNTVVLDSDFGATGLAAADVSISQAFMSSTNLLPALFDGDSNTAAIKEASKGNFTVLITLTGTLSVFLLVLSFVFLAGAFFLTVRFVMFLLLIVLSPLAFVSVIIPQTSGSFSKWFKALANNALFAPIFMALLWISLVLIKETNISTGGMTVADAAGMSGGSGDVVLQNASAPIFVAVLAIGFAFASLLIAKTLSIHGASKATQLGSKWSRRGGRALRGGAIGAGAYVTNRTAGKYAAKRADSQELKERAARGNRLAKLQLMTSDKVSSMGKKGGYRGVEKRKEEKAKKRADLYKTSPRERDRVNSNLDEARASGDQQRVVQAQQERDRVLGVNRQEVARREAQAQKIADRDIAKIHQERKRKGIAEMTRAEEQVVRAKRLERAKKAMQQKEGYSLEEVLSNEEQRLSDYVNSIRGKNDGHIREALRHHRRENQEG